MPKKAFIEKVDTKEQGLWGGGEWWWGRESWERELRASVLDILKVRCYYFSGAVHRAITDMNL